jgi:hypothetical protein
MIDLIYTSGDNRRLAGITLDAGWLVGMRSDKTATCPISFLDIDYKAPNFDHHLVMCKEHLPKIAIVPDLSDTYVDTKDIARALHQAERLAAYCEHVMLVPKLSKQIAHIPHDFLIGYSLPTTNGGAKYGVWKLSGRRVHLLGGNPHLQMKLAQAMQGYAEVVSVDGNMAQKMAFQFSKYWHAGQWMEHPLKHTGYPDLPYECIRMSLHNIRTAWEHTETPLPDQCLWNCEIA